MPRLELFEIADRAVARRGEQAWIFDAGRGWREAPVLAEHATHDGLPLEPECFARHFPEAARHAIPQHAPGRRMFRFFSHH